MNRWRLPPFRESPRWAQRALALFTFVWVVGLGVVVFAQGNIITKVSVVIFPWGSGIPHSIWLWFGAPRRWEQRIMWLYRITGGIVVLLFVIQFFTSDY